MGWGLPLRASSSPPLQAALRPEGPERQGTLRPLEVVLRLHRDLLQLRLKSDGSDARLCRDLCSWA